VISFLANFDGRTNDYPPQFIEAMKFKKQIISYLSVALLILFLVGCKDCKQEDPRARIVNNGTHKASVQIKTSGGSTVNINNIETGTASPYSSYAPGIITFTITINNIVKENTVQMVHCFDYEIIIDASNNISSRAVDRNS
jgi:PBP1b-binding outer membrane lipoprotein LpoB